MLYKYKSFINPDWVFDIIENHRIFIPSAKELNDPLEGMRQSFFTATMGVSRYRELGILQPEIEGYINEFRILSLSSEWDNMQLWAHYANNYNGVCIGFRKQGAFADASQVSYSNIKIPSETIPGIESITEKTDRQMISNNFLYKSRGWRYEKEWRIVKKTKDPYMTFDRKDIFEIIVGFPYLIENSHLYYLQGLCREYSIPLYYVRANVESYSLNKMLFEWEQYKQGEYDAHIWKVDVFDNNGVGDIKKLINMGNGVIAISDKL